MIPEKKFFVLYLQLFYMFEILLKQSYVLHC